MATVTSNCDSVQPDSIEAEEGPGGCWSADLGRGRCETRHPDDLGRWCDPCRELYLDDLAGGNDWMGGIEDGRPVSGFGHSPGSMELIRTLRPGLLPEAEPEAEEAPTLTMDAWIDAQADAIRAHGSDLAEWLADKVAEFAERCRSLSAHTPGQYDDREHIMAYVMDELSRGVAL